MGIPANAEVVCNRVVIPHRAGRDALDAAPQLSKPKSVLPEALAIGVADPGPSHPVGSDDFVHVIMPMFVQW